MDLERVLLARVEGAVPTGTVVAWNLAPRDAPVPRVVLWKVAGTFDIVLDGASGLRTGSVQVDCWGGSYKEAKALADAVLGALNAWASRADKVHGVFAVSERDQDPDSDIADREFQRSIDFDVTFWV